MLITKEMIDPIIKQRDELKAELRGVEDILASMRNVCDHDLVLAGTRANETYYKCSICGGTYSE